MARQVLPIVGAVIGGIVSYGNPYAIQAGFAIGSCEGEAADPLESNQEDEANEPAERMG